MFYNSGSMLATCISVYSVYIITCILPLIRPVIMHPLTTPFYKTIGVSCEIYVHCESKVAL